MRSRVPYGPVATTFAAFGEGCTPSIGLGSQSARRSGSKPRSVVAHQGRDTLLLIEVSDNG